MDPVLSRRSINRATIERQMLLRRATMPVPDAIEHLVGLQAQAPNPPYVGLWSRLDGFGIDDLAEMIRDRRAVRIVLMRGTIHLVTARDCVRLRPLFQPFFDRWLRSSYGQHLEGVDLDAVTRAGRGLVDEQPRTYSELGALLAEEWPGRDPRALAQVVRGMVPLVQVPPRGIWGASGPAAHAAAESWLDRPIEPDPSPDDLVLRYLRAFGPANVQDVRTWSGLTGLGEIVERLRPQLRAFRDDDGRELLDLPASPRPEPDTPAPARFLAEFDNLLLSHADRTRIIPEEHRKRIASKNGMVPGTILVDGLVRGTWKIERSRAQATLVITPFEPLTPPDRAELEEDGARLLGFVAPAADGHDVHFAS